MEQRKHWWNSRWGRIARKDVYLRVDGDRWFVEAREGGADGHSRWWEVGDEDRALEIVEGLLAGSSDWREITQR